MGDRVMTISCMGGGCRVRDECPNHNAEDRSNPSERLCGPDVARPVARRFQPRVEWQAKAIDFILERREVTVRQVAEHLGVFKPTAGKLLRALYDDGLLNRRDGPRYKGNVTNIYIAGMHLKPMACKIQPKKPKPEPKREMTAPIGGNSVFSMADALRQGFVERGQLRG